MLEKTDGAIENGNSRARDDIGHKTQNEDRQNKTQKTMCSLTTNYERPRFWSTYNY
jgi:hypothetical protein